MLRSPTRRQFAVAALSAAVFASSCTPDITGPSGVRYARGLAIQPVFTGLAAQAASTGLVPFTKVHIVLRHADNTIALDKTVDFPADVDQVSLTLDVPLAQDAPATGEPLSLTIAYVNAQGVTVFQGGPFSVLAVPTVPGGPRPAAVDAPVTYVGPGANATSVVIAPHSLSVLPGDPFAFTAQAFDDSGRVVANAPILFTTSDAALAPLTSAAAGSGTAGAGPGTANITAQLLTGAFDVATLSIGSASALTWTGAVDGDWNNAANWNPAKVPTAIDSVTIGFTNFIPTISVPAAVHSIVFGGCLSMDNSSTLTITGSYIDNSNSCLRSAITNPRSLTVATSSPAFAPGSLRLANSVSGTGSIILSGTGNLMGYLSGSDIQITGGVHTLVGPTNFGGPVTVGGSALLNANGSSMYFYSDFTTTGSGVLQMQSANAVVEIFGNATFGGGVETGLLTDGALRVDGNFTASGTKFDATGNHDLQMVGCNTPQNLDFTSPVAGHGIRTLEFSCTSAKSITGSPTVTNYLLNNSSSPITGPATVTVMGPELNANGQPWAVANTIVSTTTSVYLNGSYYSTNLTVANGTAKLENDSYTQLAGNVTVSGTSSTLDVNGSTFVMLGDFLTTNGGHLKMADPSDLDFLGISGNATFAGGSTTGLLTNGFLEIEGSFTQGGGAPDAFAASGTHQTDIGASPFGGPIMQAPALLAPTDALASGVSAGAQPRLPAGMNSKSAAMATRALAHQAELRQARLAAHAGLVRPALAVNTRAAARTAMQSRVTAQMRAARSAATAGTSATAVIAPSMTSALRARFTLGSVSFANPGFGAGKSHFATTVITASVLGLLSDVYMDGQLYADDDNRHVIGGTNNVLTSRGASVFDFQFNNVRWVLTDGADVFQLSQVLFTNMNPTVDQFTIQRSGTGTTGSMQPLFDFTFDTPPTTGHYVSATDTDGAAPDVLFIDMETPNPGVSGGFIKLANGATTNWLTAFNWTGLGATDSWDDGQNWSTGFSPSTYDDVVIKTGTPRNPLVDNGFGVVIRNLTIEAGKEIDLIGAPVIVYGNITAPTTADAVACQDGGQLLLIGDAGSNGTGIVNTVNGRFCNAYMDGNYKVAGPNNQFITTNELTIEGTGNLTVNGGRVDVGGVGGTLSAEFDVFESATLTMTNAADQMFVGGLGATFVGGSTTGLLTAGTLTIVNGPLQTFAGAGSVDPFAPSGTHKVVFSGNAAVAFFDPTVNFLRDADITAGSTLTMNSDITITGTLFHSGTGTATLGAGAAGLTLTTSGLSSTQPFSVQDVMVNFVGGTANNVFDNVTWSAFPASFTGDVFTVNRSGATTLTFTNHDFHTITLNGGHYLTNRGNAPVHMASPNPGTVTTQILQFPGTIIWP